MLTHWIRTFVVYGHPQIWRLGILGFASGLPLLLTGTTLAFWFYEMGYTKATVGFLSALAFPYTLKFVWAPIIDRVSIPYMASFFGRRRAWLLLSQSCIVLALLTLSFLDPIQDLKLMCLVCFFLSFSSATQDIVMLAYQFDTLSKYQYGAGESVSIFGYRMGMLVSSSGALAMAPTLSWPTVYQMMGLIVCACIIVTLYSPEPEPVSREEVHLQERNIALYLQRKSSFPPSVNRFLGILYGAVVCPFRDFLNHRSWVLILVLMFFYKISDNLVGTLHGIFFKEVGFSNVEIASASKFFGILASVIGGLIGGAVIVRLGIYGLLFYGCAIHGLSIFSYLIFAHTGPELWVIYTAVGLDHVTSGMRVTALFAYQMSLCRPLYAATQLALLTSVVHCGRALCSLFSGVLAETMGWNQFYVFIALLTIPVLILVHILRHDIRRVCRYDNRPPSPST